MSTTDNILPQIDLNIDFKVGEKDLAQDNQLTAYLSGLNAATNIIGKQGDKKVFYGSEALYYQRVLNKIPAFNLENNNLPLAKTETQGSPGTYCADFHPPGVSESVFDYNHGDAIELDDGSILTCGVNFTFNRSALAKFNSFGQIDKVFSNNINGYFADGNNISNLFWKRIIRTKSNDFYLVGANGINIYVAKFNPKNGIYDSSFGINGIVEINLGSFSQIQDATLQSDGKLLMCGFRSTNGLVVRFDLVNQVLDSTFGTGGFATYSFSSFQSGLNVIKFYQGKIYVGGRSAPAFVNRATVARINLNGTLDTTFNTTGFNVISTGTTGEIWGLAFQSDNKLLASGASTVGVTFDSFTARFNTSGSLDPTYAVSGVYKLNLLAPFERVLRTCVIDRDDNLYVFGNGRESPIGRHFMLLIKMNPNGTLNTSFGNGNGYLLKYLGFTDSQSFKVNIDHSLKKLLLVNYYNIDGGIYRSIVSKVNI